MKYQLTVKDTTAMEFMTKVVTLPEIFEKFENLDIISVLNSGDKLIEVTIFVDSTSINIELFEEQLNEAVLSPDSDIIEWKEKT